MKLLDLDILFIHYIDDNADLSEPLAILRACKTIQQTNFHTPFQQVKDATKTLMEGFNEESHELANAALTRGWRNRRDSPAHAVSSSKGEPCHEPEDGTIPVRGEERRCLPHFGAHGYLVRGAQLDKQRPH